MTAPAPRPLVAPPWLARAGLIAALLAFLGLGLWQSRTFMVWSEEMIVHAMPAADVLEPEPGPDGQPRFEPSCAGPGAPLLVHSASRPTLNLCLGGRAFPILIAPYFAGYFYWPAALLAPLHHDEAFALRALGMLLGVASILATFRVVRRFAGVGAAVLAALATAVMPCFLLVHATLEHFETLPWVWLMIAVDLFAGCPGLAPGSRAGARITPDAPGERDPLPTRRLVLGALALGLTIAANAKSVIVIAALAALALRLGVPFRRIRLGQWARMLAVLVVPLLPMIALSFAPEVGYSDKGTGWWRTLFAHLLDPSWLWSSLKALIFLWADIATYFGHLVVAPPLQVPALILASAALLFVLADTARTLIRGKGCPVTAAMGLCLLVYLGMVTLLYDHFPSNFTPLHTVYAVSLAMAAARLARVLVDRFHAAWPAVLVAALALLPFAASSASMIRAMGDVRVHTNTHAERALIAELGAHAAEGVPVFTADVMMAGVIDSLSRGRIRTMRAHDFFSACQPRARNPQAPACIEERWRLLLPFAVKRSARFTAPADWSRWGSEHLSYVPGLQAAAARLGYRVTLERTFDTAHGEAALSLYRIDAPGVPAPGQTQAMPAGP